MTSQIFKQSRSSHLTEPDLLRSARSQVVRSEVIMSHSNAEPRYAAATNEGGPQINGACQRPHQTLPPHQLNDFSRIRLRVGSVDFHTTRGVVRKSPLLALHLATEAGQQASREGYIYVDADPTVFPHILAYLRTGRMPLFFDSVRGHDDTKYYNLEHEAVYFQLHDLVIYLVNREYRDRASIQFSVQHVLDLSTAQYFQALDATVIPLIAWSGDWDNLPRSNAGYAVITKHVSLNRAPN